MRTVFIVHGTEGYPEENWFPWLKTQLEEMGDNVIVPQFPSPPVVPAKVSEWFDVLEKYEQYINGETIIIGHSLGGLFTLRVLESLQKPIRAALFVGAPIGIEPIRFYERDKSFSGFDFDWQKIKQNAGAFVVYHSDNDPYVCLDNGKMLAEHLGVTLSFVPNAGHFNKAAGYTEFEDLLDRVKLLN